HWLTQDYRHKQLKLINLIGAPDSGRLAVAQELCSLTGLNLAILDLRVLHSRTSERNELIGLLERDALLLDLVFYLDADSIKADERPDWKAELARFAAPFAASRERFQCPRDTLAVPVVRPDATEQAGLWMQALKEAGDPLRDDVDALVEQFDFGPQG